MKHLKLFYNMKYVMSRDRWHALVQLRLERGYKIYYNVRQCFPDTKGVHASAIAVRLHMKKAGRVYRPFQGSRRIRNGTVWTHDRRNKQNRVTTKSDKSLRYTEKIIKAIEDRYDGTYSGKTAFTAACLFSILETKRCTA